MFRQFFSSIIKKTIGNLGGGLGGIAAKYLGGYLERALFQDTIYHRSNHGIIDDFYNPNSNYGKPIPIIYGAARVNGSFLWSLDVKEKLDTYQTGSYNQFNIRNKYKYFLTFALALCEGEITNIGRTWINNQLINLDQYKYKLYKGTKDQMPDNLMQKYGPTPAYRNLAYIVFDSFPLEEFGNRFPLFSFEIFKKAISENSPENLIQNMVMIPGSGEFVYDTLIQYKNNIDPINCHNPSHIADAVYSLNQLQEHCPKLEWVAPVVTWFCDNLNIEQANIYPAVEYNDMKISTEWVVGSVKRKQAKQVSRNKNKQPNYGGTINDSSLIRYLQELRKRGLKILLYPMFFLDIPGKPWRGRVKGKTENIHDFFNKPTGYNQFILHYAQLAKGYIDAFVIGSEMIGITTLHNQNKDFPAVTELVKLAKKVKKILGPEVKVTYAADWSEYHHAANGYFHLDPLWASDDIDFIGIDAYFPLTNSTESYISQEQVKEGWTSGEGFEYVGKSKIDPKYAWKKIQYWWENEHKNPDGEITPWRPKSKKIWFTEFGFPSIDKASNQPNLFYDPECIDGGVPRHSNGMIDFSIQRTALSASLEKFRQFEFLDKAFVWCWDARPYPAWPHGNFWGDNYLWEKGHWINGKLTAASLEIILKDLCSKANIPDEAIEYSNMDHKIDGLLIYGHNTLLDVIQMLRSTYFFDIRINFSKLNFIKRGYKGQTVEFSNEKNGGYSSLNLSVVMSESEARNMARIFAQNAALEKSLLHFKLSLEYIYLQASDFIELIDKDKKYCLRIVSILFENSYLDIIATPEKTHIYYNTAIPDMVSIPKRPQIFALQHQIALTMKQFKEHGYYIQLISDQTISITGHNAEDTSVIRKKIQATIIGYVEKFVDHMVKPEWSNYFIDEMSEIIVISDQSLPDAPFYAQISQEIILCLNIQKISEKKYKLQKLQRNLYASTRNDNDKIFIILDNILSIPQHINTIYASEHKFEISESIKPQIITTDIRAIYHEGKITISWIALHPYLDDWQNEEIIDDITYNVIIKDKRYLVMHDYSCVRQIFTTNAAKDTTYNVETITR